MYIDGDVGNGKSLQVSAFAGDDVILGVESRDELGEDTPVIMRLSVDTMGMEQFKFSPSTINYDRLEEKEIRTSFLQLSEGGGDSSDNITVETLLTDFKRDSFSLTSDLCPAGYTLSPHSTLTDFSDGLWGFVDRSKEGEEGDPLETYPCPSGHCRCQLRSEGSAAQCRFTVDDRNFDDQCVGGIEKEDVRSGSTSNRDTFGDIERVTDRRPSFSIVSSRYINLRLLTGVLCGSCREGKGVTVLRKKCATCHNGFTGLVVGLGERALGWSHPCDIKDYSRSFLRAVCDAVVMVIMLLLMVPVSGALLPVIFHIQILPYLTEHFPVTFEKVQPFMLYVSSAISLFFPYDFCVSENMRVTRHPAPAHGLAWIVLLLFTPLLHTALTSLHCPTIRAAQDTGKPGPTLKSAVWYLSGDQQCFAGDHIPLSVVSLLVLLLLLATIPTVVLLSRHQIKSSRMSSHLLVAPFSHMYRSRWVWWGGVELARRVLVVLFIVAFPGNNYPVYFVLAVLVTVQAYVQPYRRMFWNFLELVLSVNVMVLLLLRNTTSIEAALQTYPAGDRDTSGSSSNGGGGGGGGGGSSEECTDEVDGITPFVILLSVLYYLPLLLSAVVAVHWLGNLVRSSSIISQLKQALHSPTKRPPELSLSSLEGPRPLRAPTTTTVDLDQLPLEDSLFSSSLKEGGGGNGERVTRGSTKFHRWGSRTSKSKD
ncbi:hypothetical protein GBAR_LOCUS550 [Geodia barretti]|uniref:Uncharacterized protein n=1 Tax=Geodia barretti TaxID=519541 RepID=A0AA35QTG6_GEOBA|nr:hypothetical protein GBAR_LOCUS550 [Geodia barretti]